MFKIGDEVQWKTMAHTGEIKRGRIVAVIPPRMFPCEVYPYGYCATDSACGRKDESYLVKVGTRLYWPHVSKLEKVLPEKL